MDATFLCKNYLFGLGTNAWTVIIFREERLRFWSDPDTELKLAKDTGVQVFRMGIDWTRVMPEEPVSGSKATVSISFLITVSLIYENRNACIIEFPICGYIEGHAVKYRTCVFILYVHNAICFTRKIEIQI